MVGRRGDLSSPVLLCNESYLEKQKYKEGKGSENTRMGKVTQSLFITPDYFALASLMNQNKDSVNVFVQYIGHL